MKPLPAEKEADVYFIGLKGSGKTRALSVLSGFPVKRNSNNAAPVYLPGFSLNAIELSGPATPEEVRQ